MNRQFFFAFGLALTLLSTRPLQAQLTETEEVEFSQVVAHANLLMPDTGPHMYDTQIPAWTNQLTALFPKIISCPLPTYEAARDRLLQGAQNFDTIDPTRKPVFKNTYHAMMLDRLASPTGALAQATQTLLRLTMAATPEVDLFAFVNSCNPLNPSASAVYNVFFKWTVNQLQRELNQQKEDAALIEAVNHSINLQEELQEEDEGFEEAVRNSLKTHATEEAQKYPPLVVTLSAPHLWKKALRKVSNDNLHLIQEFSRFNEMSPDTGLMKSFLQMGSYTHLTAKELTEALATHILINAIS